MDEKERVFNENATKYGKIFRGESSEQEGWIENKLIKIRKELNEYYNDKDVILLSPQGITKSVIKNTNLDAGRYHPYINVYCTDSEEVNAFAKKIEGDYYIGICKGVFKRLHRHIENYVMDEEFSKIPEVGMVFPERMIQILEDHCWKYLIFHEFFHIMNGHCDYIQKLGISELCEVSDLSADYGMIRQTLEYDADSCAIASIMNGFWGSGQMAVQMMQDSYGRLSSDSVIQFISGLLIAIYVFTSWLNVIRFTELESTEEELEKMTHPIPGIRLYSMWATIFTVLEKVKIYTQEEKEEIIDRSMQAVMTFISVFKDVAYPGYLRYTFEPICLKHLQKVHNNWKYVRGELTSSYNELAPFEEVDFCQ